VDEFATTLSEWKDFYIAISAAAATLMGLLFVSVSLKSEIYGDPRYPDLRATAVNTFASFLFLLLDGLYVLIPHQSTATLGWTLVITTVFQVRLMADEIRNVLRSVSLRGVSKEFIWRLILPFLSAMVVLGVGIGLIFGKESSLDWLVSAVIAMLVTATRNAWYLLLETNRREGMAQN
jgi:hypothetical protein